VRQFIAAFPSENVGTSQVKAAMNNPPGVRQFIAAFLSGFGTSHTHLPIVSPHTKAAMNRRTPKNDKSGDESPHSKE
jgi:hypothetical protein